MNTLRPSFFAFIFFSATSALFPEFSHASVCQGPSRDAKIALTELYNKQKAFYSEYAAYSGSLEAIGFKSPFQADLYAVGFRAGCTLKVTGFEGKAGVPNTLALLDQPGASYRFSQNTVLVRQELEALFESLPCLPANSQTFTALAIAPSENSGKFDVWSINETKTLTNIEPAQAPFAVYRTLGWLEFSWKLALTLLVIFAGGLLLYALIRKLGMRRAGLAAIACWGLLVISTILIGPQDRYFCGYRYEYSLLPWERAPTLPGHLPFLSWRRTLLPWP